MFQLHLVSRLASDRPMSPQFRKVHCPPLLLLLLLLLLKKGWQCKAVRERLTPYQFEDPNPTKPTHRMKEEKGKRAGDKKWANSQANKKALALLLKPASPTPSNMGAIRSFHRDTDKGIKVRRYTAKFCSEEAHKWTDVRSQRRLLPAPAHTAQGEHHKECASGHT